MISAENLFSYSQEYENIKNSLHLLTAKPILYVLNKKAGAKIVETKPVEEYLGKLGVKRVVVDAKIEGELSELGAGDKEEFKKELGVGDDGVNDLIKTSYEMLGLITFLTTGQDETRAWTIKKGWTAPEAGTAIHTDFRDKFIRAEVINWQDLVNAGSYASAREKGLVRTEGKEYVVRDGDVVEFKI